MGLVFVPITLIATSGVPAGRRGARVGPLQHLAADRRRARARAPLDVRDEQDHRRALVARPPADPAEQASALVDGFHVAWLGSAILLALGAVLLFALLRRSDVVAVAEGEVAPVAA